jgi:hypothetical protein
MWELLSCFSLRSRTRSNSISSSSFRRTRYSLWTTSSIDPTFLYRSILSIIRSTLRGA